MTITRADEQLIEQRLDETEVGDGTTVVITTAKKPDFIDRDATGNALSRYFGLDEKAKVFTDHDIYDAVLAPRDLMLITVWQSSEDAAWFTLHAKVPEDAFMRTVRIIRDYGKYDRREAPQYYAAVEKSP